MVFQGIEQDTLEGGGTGKVEKTRSSREEAAALAAAGTGPAPRWGPEEPSVQRLSSGSLRQACFACTARQVAEEAAAGRACLLQWIAGCKTSHHHLAGIDITKLPPLILT